MKNFIKLICIVIFLVTFVFILVISLGSRQGDGNEF
jgi:hypothetical protein